MSMQTEVQILNNILLKYKKITRNTSYVKYNFIIELVNNNLCKLKTVFNLQDKTPNQTKIPLMILNQKKTFDVNNIYFLINDEFKTDINLLLIYQTENISTIYNGIIIDMNDYTIICMPDKNNIYSRFNTFKKYNDDDILYEYDIYKLYDGDIVNLYYNNKLKTWNLSNKNEINIDNKIMDKLNDETFISFFYKMLNEYKLDINNLNKTNTYLFYLINKNYNLSNQKNKLKFIQYNNFYNDNTDDKLNQIKIKQLYSIYAKSKYGLILKSKNNLENRLIFFDYYQKIKKIIYTPISTHSTVNLDLKYITIRAILRYKISKNDIFNTYPFLIKYYKYILTEIDNIIELFLQEFPDFSNVNKKYKYFIIKINNDIKNNKNVNDIFYNNYITLKNNIDLNIYKLILRDFVTQHRYITDLYNILF
tara:strand:+ start:284 stop:1546 length:1263 start_codon:yes stop_codon:yes gene_type:complete